MFGLKRRLDRIIALLSIIAKEGLMEMANLDDIKNEIAAEKTVIDSAVKLIGGLSAQLKAAVAANDMTALQAIIDGMEANKAELAAAVTANTPADNPAQTSRATA